MVSSTGPVRAGSALQEVARIRGKIMRAIDCRLFAGAFSGGHERVFYCDKRREVLVTAALLPVLNVAPPAASLRPGAVYYGYYGRGYGCDNGYGFALAIMLTTLAFSLRVLERKLGWSGDETVRRQ